MPAAVPCLAVGQGPLAGAIAAAFSSGASVFAESKDSGEIGGQHIIWVHATMRLLRH